MFSNRVRYSSRCSGVARRQWRPNTHLPMDFTAKKSFTSARKRSLRTSRAMSFPVRELIADEAMVLTKVLTSSVVTSAHTARGANAIRAVARKAVSI